jgi:hypothetical protein
MSDTTIEGGGNGSRTSGGKKAVHPGAGRRKAIAFPKGRLLDPADTEAVQSLIGAPPYERPMLIEYLHKIQDAEGCLPAGHLHGLSELMRIPMAEVYEVATFYAHFDVVPDGAERPAKTTIRVCESLSCMLAGAEQLIARFAVGRYAKRACCARAVYWFVSHRSGSSRRASSCRSCDAGIGEGLGAGRPRAPRCSQVPVLRGLCGSGGIQSPEGLPCWGKDRRRSHRDAVGWRPARAWRGRISDGQASGVSFAPRRARG